MLGLKKMLDAYLKEVDLGTFVYLGCLPEDLARRLFAWMKVKQLGVRGSQLGFSMGCNPWGNQWDDGWQTYGPSWNPTWNPDVWPEKFGEVTGWDGKVWNVWSVGGFWFTHGWNCGFLNLCAVLSHVCMRVGIWFGALWRNDLVEWNMWLLQPLTHIYQQASLKWCNFLPAHVSRNNMWFATSQTDIRPKEHCWPLPLSPVEKDHIRKESERKSFPVFSVRQGNHKNPNL